MRRRQSELLRQFFFKFVMFYFCVLSWCERNFFVNSRLPQVHSYRSIDLLKEFCKSLFHQYPGVNVSLVLTDTLICSFDHKLTWQSNEQLLRRTHKLDAHNCRLTKLRNKAQPKISISYMTNLPLSS